MITLTLDCNAFIYIVVSTDVADRIVELDAYLETEQVELDKWIYFRVSNSRV